MTLEDEMRRVLARMSLLQYGKVQSFNSSGGRSENPDPRPQGEGWTLADHWAAEWAREPSHRTVEAARAELEAWLKRATPAETDGTAFEDWVIEDGENYAVAQVAGKFGIPESRVRRIRLKNGRETEFGLLIDHTADKDRSEERVAYLSGRGCSWREIAAQTGLHKTQVQRILARQRSAA